MGKKTARNIAGETILNKFHMLFGGFRSKKSSRINPEGFKENNIKKPNACDPQYYKDFQALRFLKVAQGEEENTSRLKDELKNNPYVRDSKVKINLREVQEKKTNSKENPLAVFAYENYCKDKSGFFSDAKEKTLIKKEIDFLTKWEVIEKVEQGGFTFVIEDGKATLALYDGKATEITIPQTVNGCPVTKIGDYCFYQEPKERTIEKVTIPSTVEEIAAHSFDHCSLLKSIVFDGKSKLKKIGPCAFENCEQLNDITIPKSVERIERCAFSPYPKLESITFENREKPIFIEPSAFSWCPFSNLTFPHNVEFGDTSFCCTRNYLKTITFTGSGEIKRKYTKVFTRW